MSDNPLLTKLNKTNKIPGLTYILPSKGIIYTNGELSDDVVDGEIHVHPMSTLDQIYLQTQDMLFSGEGITKVIARCCPQILKPRDLAPRDVDYLLTCIRIVSFGEIIDIEYTCNCKYEKQENINLKIATEIAEGATELTKPYKPEPEVVPVNLSKFINEMVFIEPNYINDMISDIDGFLVKFGFARYGQIVEASQSLIADNVNTNSPEGLYRQFIDNLVISIDSVDDISDKAMIKEFLESADRRLQMKIIDSLSSLSQWGLKFTEKHRCKECKKINEVEVPLNPQSFFTEL